MICPPKFHCWIPYRWKFENPWGVTQMPYPVPSDLKTFTFTHIAHTTHTEEKNGIVRKKGIEAKQWVIEKKKTGYSFQMPGSKPEQLREDKVFPGYYVFFALIIPELDSKQKQACLALIKRFDWGFGKTEFSDYIENHSRYGNWMFPMTIDEALELYKYSIEQETKETVEEIKFKLMGTNRYQSSVVYTVAVTARLEGEEKDPLHEYQDWNIASLYHHKGDTTMESDRETVVEEPPPKKKKIEETQSHEQEGLSHVKSHVTRTKIVFNPKAVVCIPKKHYYTRDYIEIAFHFQSKESVFHLKSSELDRSTPEEVFHHVCVRSRVRTRSKAKDCLWGDGRPEYEWKINQEKRFK